MTNEELANECDSVADTMEKYGGRGCGRKLRETASRLRAIAEAAGESMADERNALAELAERLDVIIPYVSVSCTVCETDKHLTSKRAKDFVVIAQRIIASLANVDTASDLVVLIGKCRAIAAEGEEG